MGDKTKKTIVSLTSAALSIPGMPKMVYAESAAEETRVSYRFSSYEESPLPSSNLSGSVTSTGADGENVTTRPSVERFSIQSHQLSAKTPISGESEIGMNLVIESMSGASPWIIEPDRVTGEPKVVMSGASIEDQRVDAGVSFTTYNGNSKTASAVSFSNENDYTSIGFSTVRSTAFNNELTTLELGISSSKDIVSATDPEFNSGISSILPSRATNKSKVSAGFLVGVSQVINRSTVVNTSVEYALYQGYLSDPYKLVYVENQLQIDNRPRNRRQFAFDTKLRRHFSALNSTLHLDYRFFTNDWGINSHTIDTAWYFNFLENTLQISPQLRFYDQSEAAFFNLIYDQARSDNYYSNDYRLSSFRAISGRLKVNYFLPRATLRFSWEQYSSGQGSSESTGGLHPALVDFTNVQLGFDFRF